MFENILEELEGINSMYEELKYDLNFDKTIINGNINLIPKCNYDNGVKLVIGDNELKLNFVPPINFKFIIYEDPFKIDFTVTSEWMNSTNLEKLRKKLINDFLNEDSFVFQCLNFIECDLLEYFYGGNCHINFDIESEETTKLVDFMILFDTTEQQRKFLKQYHECCSCLMTKKGEKCIKLLSCQHIFCNDCGVHFFKTSIKQGNLDLKCLECGRNLEYHEIKPILDEETFCRFDELLLKKYLNCNTKPCPRCGKKVLVDKDKLGQCDSCQYVFCIQCLEKYHGENICDNVLQEFKENLKNSIESQNLTLENYAFFVSTKMIERGCYDKQLIENRIAEISEFEKKFRILADLFEEDVRKYFLETLVIHKDSFDTNDGDNWLEFIKGEVNEIKRLHINSRSDDDKKLFVKDIVSKMCQLNGKVLDETAIQEKQYRSYVLVKQMEYEERQTMKLIGDEPDRCPQCKEVYQKISGCNKMTCNMCGSFFCHLCKLLLDNGAPYLHFGILPNCPLC